MAILTWLEVCHSCCLLHGVRLIQRHSETGTTRPKFRKTWRTKTLSQGVSEDGTFLTWKRRAYCLVQGQTQQSNVKAETNYEYQHQGRVP